MCAVDEASGYGAFSRDVVCIDPTSIPSLLTNNSSLLTTLPRIIDRYATRDRVRQARSLPIPSDLRKWLDASLGAVVPQSLTGKALAYLNGQWPKLAAVFERGEVPLDTNLVENAIRPFAIGRKNWMFADTVYGAEASVNLYSVVETAKANDLEPWAYLERVFEQIPRTETLEDLDTLLPHRIRLCNDGVN